MPLASVVQQSLQSDPCGSFDQALSRSVFADPAQDGSHSLFHIREGEGAQALTTASDYLLQRTVSKAVETTPKGDWISGRRLN